MYKKYIHPVYNWYNEEYKQLDENKWISSKGEIITSDKISEEVKNDQEKIDAGDYNTKLTDYGFLDSTEQEFVLKVYEQLEGILKEILSKKTEILKIKQLTGVNFEI